MLTLSQKGFAVNCFIFIHTCFNKLKFQVVPEGNKPDGYNNLHISGEQHTCSSEIERRKHKTLCINYLFLHAVDTNHLIEFSYLFTAFYCKLL